MSTYVLVHGAYHGGWCYEKIVPQLEMHGHTAIAVDLPGHGENQIPVEEVTLVKYVDHVCDLINAQNESIILVGHSLGGMTITEVAERVPEKVVWVVYLTALMLKSGQERSELSVYDDPVPMTSKRIVSKDGFSATMPLEIIPETFYSACSQDDMARAMARLVPQAIDPIKQTVSTTLQRFGTVRRAYIECLQDRAIPIAMQRAMIAGQPCEKVFSIDTDHSPFYSAPDELTAHLLTLSAS